MINQEDYEILKDLDDRLGWLARDKDGDLVAYENKPEKSTRFWFDNGRMVNLGVIFDVGRLFQFIQWEDEEPHSIAELIEEHERSQAYEIFNRQFESLYEKIKETEVKKDKEWLKEKVIETARHVGHEYLYINIQTVLELIDQLDEPEVLSQELPVIPKFVADWIEDNKKQNKSIVFAIGHIYDENEIGKSPTEKENRIFQWMELADNDEVFVRSWLDGYTVEKEQKYYAKIKGHELVSDREDCYWNVDRKELYIDNIWHDYSGYKTTKLTKYDWNNLGINEDNADFVKVEEVE